MSATMMRRVLRAVFRRVRLPMLGVLAIRPVRALARRIAWRFPRATLKFKHALFGNGMIGNGAFATLPQGLSAPMLSPRAQLIREKLGHRLGTNGT